MDDSVELRSFAGSVLKDSFPSPPGEGEDEGFMLIARFRVLVAHGDRGAKTGRYR